MKEEQFHFRYEVYESQGELSARDAALLQQAKGAADHAYAPYSNFFVGAAARLSSGEVVRGFNQENASFPAGMCAERVLLAAVASLFPGGVIEAIAISYKSEVVKSDHPVAPCGICRQSLQEFESRSDHPIRLILGGMEGKVLVFPDAGCLLPFSFTSAELNA